MFEIRFNPIAGEWVIIAAERMKRPVLPAGSCPFCPGVGKTPANYDVLVYQNDFPSMTLAASGDSWVRVDAADGPTRPPTGNLYAKRPSFGACEVILYSPDHSANIYDLPDWHIEKLVRCWQERTRQLGSIKGIEYVFVFENRGEAVGVTIHHPHGQVYAFPFVPRKIQREIESCSEYSQKSLRCLVCDMVSEELRQGIRLVKENEHFLCLVPYFARFPFEAHIISRRHLGSVVDLSDAEVIAFGEILQALVRGYDTLFGFTTAYIMAFHQAPTDAGQYQAYHFHVEFYPAHADSKTRKHLSGTEIGIDVFVNPSDVEVNAALLRRAIEASEQ
ncbi:MAG: galactose-1-phosphate uridylyltransferase [Candidatus Coatesbacteria bacterium]|nr:galactose-1-phosphate uridylyltransferase [Candidatus Coatesbacteria bacterium]